jgi:D-glycero-D-manno-heptose 1,7-bisphosphate phosphatase
MTTWHEPGAALPCGPVLFLDRDGVVIEDRHYLSDPDEVVLVDGAAQAFAAARSAGFRIVGVSNQSGLGRGIFGLAQFEAVMRRVDELLAAEGAAFDAMHYCPHAPGDDCACRKPLPGLLEDAARRVPYDPARSWVVGDKASDVELARRAGLGAVLVHTGYGAGEAEGVRERWGGDPRVLQAPDLPGAVQAILAAEGTLP